jgi:hypothetical protein
MHRRVGDDHRVVRGDAVQDPRGQLRLTGEQRRVEQLAGDPLSRRRRRSRLPEPVHHGVERGVGERRAVRPAVEQHGAPQVHVRLDEAWHRHPVPEFEHLGARTAQAVQFGAAAQRPHPAAADRKRPGAGPGRIHGDHRAEH